MKILTVEQMTEVDRLSTREYGVPSLILMENAGLHTLRALQEQFGNELRHQRISILCGRGNNGGDGLVLARQLVQRRIQPRVYLFASAERVEGDAAVNLEIYRRAGGSIIEVESDDSWDRHRCELESADIIVDALLGTGLSKPLAGRFAEAVTEINSCRAFVLAVDIPSGMFSDRSQPSDSLVVRADCTVTFTAPKVAHILTPRQDLLGQLRVAPIGSPAALLENSSYFLHLMEPEMFAARVAPRPAESHKGSLGKVALMGGSPGKSGAIILSSQAALRAGSGLVTAVIPESVSLIVAAADPNLMTEALKMGQETRLSDHAQQRSIELLSAMDAAALGPGLGTAAAARDLVAWIFRTADLPLVVDADALNILAADPSLLADRSSRQPVILTPHPGEFSRLAGQPTEVIQRDRVAAAREFAMSHSVWLVLKGFRTVVAEPSGRVFVCPRGNPGMATGGMGDVLTGVLASRLGQLVACGNFSPADITTEVCLGVYLHSLAGDLAEDRTGPESLIASTLLEHLGEAYRTLRTSRR